MDNPGVIQVIVHLLIHITAASLASASVQAENQVDTALPFLPPPHARLSERADLMRAVGPSPDCQER